MSQSDSFTQYDRIPMELWEAMAKEGIDFSVDVYTSGISMWPLLHAYHDSVKVIYSRRELMVGDIIMFRRADKKEIAHRIYWMDDEMVGTIGDNCDSADEKIPRSSVLGLVTHVCRRGHLIHVDTAFWRFYGRFMIWSNPVRMFIRNRIFRPVRRLARKLLKGK